MGLRISGVKGAGLIHLCAFGHRQAGRLPGQAARASSCSRSGGGTCPKVGGKASFIITDSGAGAKWIMLREGIRSPKVRPRELTELGRVGVTGHTSRRRCPGAQPAAHCPQPWEGRRPTNISSWAVRKGRRLVQGLWGLGSGVGDRGGSQP